MYQRLVEDDLTDVGDAVAWVDGLITGERLAESLRFAIEVCVEEALANLVLHGRVASGGKRIALGFAANHGGAEIVIEDSCAAFDLAREPMPVRPESTDGPIGGQGIRLIHAFASRLAYFSEGGRNALTLWFDPPAEAVPAGAA